LDFDKCRRFQLKAPPRTPRYYELTGLDQSLRDGERYVAKLPDKPGRIEVEEFLAKVAATSAANPGSRRGRLIFALDATMSREPTWDNACQIQGEMFKETAQLGGLDVQLVYYRGFGECRASKWVANPKALLRLMTSVSCHAGRTQIERILAHAIRESRKHKVDAVVFVGDALEENIDALGQRAGELGILGVPVFVFHEGGDHSVRRAFEEIARLSGGAYCPFDTGSARQLRELLRAVAVYASGGHGALLEHLDRNIGSHARLLSSQLRGKS
jgi:hypothetical protein